MQNQKKVFSVSYVDESGMRQTEYYSSLSTAKKWRTYHFMRGRKVTTNF